MVTLFGHCKGVWDGGQISATGCGTARLLGNGAEGAHPLVSRKTLPTPVIGLPAVVDHRAEGTEGVVRNQGSAPACTAFSAAAAIDHAISRWLGKASHVSVMQVWSRYHTPFEATTVSSNLEKTLGAEEDWPFDAKTATLMLPCDQGAKPGTCGAQPDPKKSAVALQRSVSTFTRAHKLEDTEPQTIELALASGQDVVVTMEVPQAFVPTGRAGARYIPHYTVTPPDAFHALLVSGYAAFKGGTYFLLHNSWGTEWGDAGYVWMHQATLAAHIKEAIIIDAEPLTYDGALRPRRQRGEVTCAGALVPDSIAGTCAAICPDGSPRHDAVCPAATSPCPAGYVNLTGACVRARSPRDPRRCRASSCPAPAPGRHARRGRPRAIVKSASAYAWLIRGLSKHCASLEARSPSSPAAGAESSQSQLTSGASGAKFTPSAFVSESASPSASSSEVWIASNV